MTRLLAIAVVLLPALATAQVPGKLGYQGRLLKADGNPETGVVSLLFAVHAAESGGQPLWSETQTLAVAEGYYATRLGEVVALPPDLFQGAERFLEVSVGGVALTPRHRIASVPYALAATDARNVVGGSVSASSLTVNGKALTDSSGRLDYGQLAGCAGAGEILKWDGSKWACGADAGGMTSVAVAAPLTGSGTAGSPIGLSTGGCSAGQVLKFDGSAWACAADVDTDTKGLTAVATAAPLAGDGTGGAPVSLSACPAGQVLKSNGSGWACAADAVNAGTVTAVTAAAPLASSGGAAPNITLAKAAGSADGYLAKEDFARFDSKRTAGGRNLIDWQPVAAEWAHVAGTSPTVSVNGNDVLEGDSSFEISVGSGTAGTVLVYGDPIPVYTGRRYVGRVLARYVTGGGTFSAGFQALNAAKAPIAGTGSQNHFIVNATSLPTNGTWVEFRGSVQWEGATLGRFPPGTRYIRPLIATNQNNVGTTRVDGFELYEEADSHCQSRLARYEAVCAALAVKGGYEMFATVSTNDSSVNATTGAQVCANYVGNNNIGSWSCLAVPYVYDGEPNWGNDVRPTWSNCSTPRGVSDGYLWFDKRACTGQMMACCVK